MKGFLMGVAALALMVGVALGQKIEVKGGYNGHGYVPGYTLDLNTGWARVSGPSGGYNYRPSSGHTYSPLPTTPQRDYSPRVGYNYGVPYIVQPGIGNFRPEPRGGWYRGYRGY